MASFFISYSRADLAYAEKLRKHLQLIDSGNDIFLDLYNIKAGERWRDRLRRGIVQNQFFLLLLSGSSARSHWVTQEVQWVRQSELKAGLRKLFVLRLDDVRIPDQLAAFQILNLTGNFTIDFYKLMEGILAKNTYYTVLHSIKSDNETGYNVTLCIDAPKEFMRLVEVVEYRLDHEFADPVQYVEETAAARANGFKINIWTSEPILVFVVIYLKTIRQVSIEHRVPIYF